MGSQNVVTIWDWTEAIVRDKSLPLAAFKTAIALSTFADWKTGHEARPGQSKLAEILGTTDRAVRKNLDALEHAGWIEKVSRGGRAGAVSYASVYELRIPPPEPEVPVEPEVPAELTGFTTGTSDVHHRNFSAPPPEPRVPTTVLITPSHSTPSQLASSAPSSSVTREPVRELPPDRPAEEQSRLLFEKYGLEMSNRQ